MKKKFIKKIIILNRNIHINNYTSAILFKYLNNLNIKYSFFFKKQLFFYKSQIFNICFKTFNTKLFYLKQTNNFFSNQLYSNKNKYFYYADKKQLITNNSHIKIKTVRIIHNGHTSKHALCNNYILINNTDTLIKTNLGNDSSNYLVYCVFFF